MRDYSNYHNTNYTDKVLRDGVKIFERSLLTSPDSSIVTVGNIEKRIMIQSTSKYNERRILFKKDDIHWGDLVVLEGEKWLVTERPFFNKIHEKSKIELCTTSMVFTVMTGGYYEETDRYGNPIWIEEPTKSTTEFPCVISPISDLNTKTTLGQQINVPEGDVVLTISYTTNELIEMTSDFTIYGDAYTITGIDKSKVYQDQGVLTLIASRESNNT